jgi:soluble lytic murein transglycosylase-like protein
MIRRVAFLALAALATGVPPSAAAQLVLFDDGRGLVVDAWEPDHGVITLILEGGGSMTVPADRITSIRSYAGAGDGESGEVGGGELSDALRARAGEYADMISDVAERYDLPPALLAAMAQAESNFDPYAVSHKGACGILQLLPATAERFGVADVFDAASNIEGGAKYMRWLLDRFDGRTDLALAAYNAGEQTVARYDGIPPYRETRTYVARVMEKAGLETRIR